MYRRSGRTTRMIREALTDLQTHEGLIAILSPNVTCIQLMRQMFFELGGTPDDDKRVYWMSAPAVPRARGHRFRSVYIDHTVQEMGLLTPDWEDALMAMRGTTLFQPETLPAPTMWERLMSLDYVVA